MSEHDDTTKEVRRAAIRTAELAIEMLTEPEGVVDPGGDYAEIAALFRGKIGEEGVGIEAAVREFERDILPHAMRPGNPMYFGLVNSSALPGAVLGELLVASLDSNAGAFHHTRSITPIEDELIGFLSNLTYGHGSASGQFVPAGSYANLQAMLLARASGVDRGPAPRLYVSDAMHFSVSRAARFAGIDDWVVEVATDARGAMLVADLEQRLATDREAGRTPVAVFTTAGTTATGAIDPLDAIARLCEAHDLWLHVDACYGGGALLSEALRPRFAGIERADSVSIDPHKWFFMPLAAGVLLTTHPELELETFDPAGDSYIPSDGPLARYRLGISASRRASPLTVWVGLRAHGIATIRDAVERNIELTRKLEDLLAERGFRVLEGGELSIACARWEPDDVDDLDAEQERIAAAAVASGKTWFATTRHAGETWLRFNIVNLHTRERHLEVLVELLGELAS